MDAGSLLTSEQSAYQNYTSVLWAGESITYVGMMLRLDIRKDTEAGITQR